jgi:iron complex outermembrane receptor protein
MRDRRPRPARWPLVALCIAGTAGAQTDSTLPTVNVTGTPSTAERNQWPLTTESVTAADVRETVNMFNAEDALKYLPNVLIRKRHIGDTQAPMSTRTSGVGASARSLIYVDGLLISALIGNNNTTASPRWGMVAPEEIRRVDVMYGPFAAAYPGNSIGTVVEIVTRMPEHLEVGTLVQGGSQSFRQYATEGTYGSARASALVGDRAGPVSWWFGANHLESQSQPLAFVTATRPAAPSSAGTPVTGAFIDQSRTGAPIAVIGAGGFEHQFQDNVKAKVAIDLAPNWQATYTIGAFLHDDRARAESYVRNAAGDAVYSGTLNIGGFAYAVPASAFSNNVYRQRQDHLMQGLALRSTTGGEWDVEAVASLYDFSRDELRVPTTALPGAQNGGAGTITRLDGTGWNTIDVRAVWRPGFANAAHHVTFGVHHDNYKLVSPRYATSDWAGGSAGALASDARGQTRTEAVFVQDVWRLAPTVNLTLGGREEWWRAFDGYNFSAAPALSVNQPAQSATRFSPKLALAWAPADGWLATAATGVAYRFPTVTELYQAIATGPTLTVPNPDLKPERAVSAEIALEKTWAKGRVRGSVFAERVTDALLSQTAPLVPGSTQLFNFVQNVDRTRARGAELVVEQRDVGVTGLDLDASVTYVDPKIVADAAFPAAVGKQTPQVPRWRYSAVATYRPNERLAATLAVRYSNRVFATIDNSDVYTHTYQGFDSYLVVDTRVNYRFADRWSAAVGIDNLTNARYFLFHSFPQRTVIAEVRYEL